MHMASYSNLHGKLVYERLPDLNYLKLARQAEEECNSLSEKERELAIREDYDKLNEKRIVYERLLTKK